MIYYFKVYVELYPEEFAELDQEWVMKDGSHSHLLIHMERTWLMVSESMVLVYINSNWQCIKSGWFMCIDRKCVMRIDNN